MILCTEENSPGPSPCVMSSMRSPMNHSNWKDSSLAAPSKDTSQTCTEWTIPDAPFELQMNWRLSPPLVEVNSNDTPERWVPKCHAEKFRFVIICYQSPEFPDMQLCSFCFEQALQTKVTVGEKSFSILQVCCINFIRWSGKWIEVDMKLTCSES